MGDASVAAALRSTARLVVVEAPAGTGKTYQGASYASDIAATKGGGRALILTHTHAACDVFSARTAGSGGRVVVRTMDGLIGEVASAYHLALGLPHDVGRWARSRKDGYSEVAAKVAGLLRRAPMIETSLSARYPVVICDEHQDASKDQHEVAIALHRGGSLLRIFADPMQRIFGSKTPALIQAEEQRWQDLKLAADTVDELDEPHRWASGSVALGQWTLRARSALAAGDKIDLRHERPAGLTVLIAENRSARQRGGYQLAKDEGKPIYNRIANTDALLVLSSQNETVGSLRALFGRRIPIWEGHVRTGLETLVAATEACAGDPAKAARAAFVFVNHVGTGFSASAFGDRLFAEVDEGCSAKARGKPATLQALAKILLDEPNHIGIAKMLGRLEQAISDEPAFDGVKIDHRREFWDARDLAAFDDPHEGLAQIAHRRTHSRPALPTKAISTVHKAKGLECENAVLIPCDALHFADRKDHRALLYVALSRATHSLTIVAPKSNTSPLIMI